MNYIKQDQNKMELYAKWVGWDFSEPQGYPKYPSFWVGWDLFFGDLYKNMIVTILAKRDPQIPTSRIQTSMWDTSRLGLIGGGDSDAQYSVNYTMQGCANDVFAKP